MKHTQTPWTINYETKKIYKNGKNLDWQDYSRIINILNSHDDLLEAAKDYVSVLKGQYIMNLDATKEEISKVEKAIQKAESK